MFIPHSNQWTDHPDKKINKETEVLNETPDQMDLIDIYWVFHRKKNRFHIFLKCT